MIGGLNAALRFRSAREADYLELRAEDLLKTTISVSESGIDALLQRRQAGHSARAPKNGAWGVASSDGGKGVHTSDVEVERFSFVASPEPRIKRGEILGGVRETMISGGMIELLKDIDVVGSDKEDMKDYDVPSIRFPERESHYGLSCGCREKPVSAHGTRQPP